MFLNMVDDLCFGDKKKAENLNYVLTQVCFKGKFTSQDLLQLVSLGIMPSESLKCILGCEPEILMGTMYNKSLQYKKSRQEYKSTNIFVFIGWVLVMPFIAAFNALKEIDIIEKTIKALGIKNVPRSGQPHPSSD